MNSAVPLIFSRDTLPPGPSLAVRGLAALVALGSLAVLVIGAWLRPGAEGHGTHVQLGMAECQFLLRTGLPCPSCGYTTAVTYFVHGNWIASFYVQPMGFLVALFFCVSVWVGGYVAVTGRPVYRLLNRLPGRRISLILLSIALAGWGWKIFLHRSGHDHWPP